MESRNQSALPSSCDSEDYRCLCGSLMAKITSLGVEIKCRKCKRIQVIPNSQITFEVAPNPAKAVGDMFQTSTNSGWVHETEKETAEQEPVADSRRIANRSASSA